VSDETKSGSDSAFSDETAKWPSEPLPRPPLQVDELLITYLEKDLTRRRVDNRSE
jgi:hypothetical protein